MEKLEKNNGNVQLQALIKYGTDLTKMAFEGKLDPVIGREKEIQRVTQILCKRRKNNACLIGDPGVGKTVIAEGLAIILSNDVDVPSRLTGNKIFALEMGRLIAGTTFRGDFEERLTEIVDEVTKSNGNIILFIDELHTLIGAGGSGALDAGNILKPALARGQVKCIGATTLEEYRKYIEKDAALKRRFVAVQVPEPCIDDAIQILKGVQNKYEVFHNVKYEEEAIIACVDLSKKYINEQFLPDKAIDLIDEAGSRVQVLQPGKPETTLTVTKNDVANVISSMTGIPVEQICGEHDEESAKRLLSLEKILSKHVIDQDEAISVISRAIRRAQVGLRDPQRPVATFLFTGPTGVGKTETAKVLAREYYGSSKDEHSMIRLDMSEYMESHSVSKLIGSPPGYVGYNEGGQLTEAIRRKQHSLVLFDEIEKAHPKVFNAFLQILDDGRLTDGKGRTVDFKNTIIIMTSNVVTNEDDVVEKLKETFKPEFLNRLDEVVVFKNLDNKGMKKILEMMLRKVVERIRVNNKVEVQMTENFKEKLLKESRTNSYGARPLKRTIARLLEDNLAESILNGSIKKGDKVLVDINWSDKVIIHHKKSTS